MKALLVHLDDSTDRALDRIAPATQRRRSQFIRDAVRHAVRQAEYTAMRSAYQAQPDSEAEADDWSTAEEYKPGSNMKSGGPACRRPESGPFCC